MGEVKRLDVDGLKAAYEGSWYTILGVDDIDEYVAGYEDELEQAGVGKPDEWYQTLGETVNRFFEQKAGGRAIRPNDQFRPDLTILLFAHVGSKMDPLKLPIFKIRWQDRWFDDLVDNVVERAS